MIKKLIFLFLVASSTNLYTEFINLDCKANNSYKDLSFNLLLGTETQRATQILKKGQLTMELKVSNEFYVVSVVFHQFRCFSKHPFLFSGSHPRPPGGRPGGHSHSPSHS